MYANIFEFYVRKTKFSQWQRYSLADINGRQSPRVELCNGGGGGDRMTRRRTEGAGTVKGWKDKRNHGSISDTFT